MNRQTTLEKIFYFFITKIIFGIAVIAALVALIEQVGRPLLDRTSLSGNAKNIIISLANSAIALTAYILLFRFYEKRKITELRISSFLTNAAAGFAAGFALQAIFILVIYFAGGYEVIKINPASFILPAFGYALTAGFVAEILIVGVFFRLTEQQLGTVPALFIIAVLFGIFHFNAPGATALSIMATAVEAGLLIASIYVYTRSLWAVIFFHFAWDLAEPGVFGGINPGMNVTETLLVSKITGPAILTGGPTGPQNSIQSLLICLSVSLLLLWLAKRKSNFIRPYWKK